MPKKKGANLASDDPVSARDFDAFIKKKRISTAAAAEYFGCSLRTIHNWRRGMHEIPPYAGRLYRRLVEAAATGRTSKVFNTRRLGRPSKGEQEARQRTKTRAK